MYWLRVTGGSESNLGTSVRQKIDLCGVKGNREDNKLCKLAHNREGELDSYGLLQTIGTKAFFL